MQEFDAAADDDPIVHQRLSGLPTQSLTKRAWEDFRLANYGRSNRIKKGEWEEWAAHPDGLACSRFVGSGDKAALDRFRRLADTGMALLKAAAVNAGTKWHFDTSIVDQIESESSKDTYLSWLDAVHLTAKQCRTLFLHAEVSNWAYARRPDEAVEQVATAMSVATAFGLSAFPIHPIMESLQHDVFRSSSEAIKVWIGATDVVRVGEWAERPPIYLPLPIDDPQPPIAGETSDAPSSVVAPDEQHGQGTSPTTAANKLLVDRDTFSASYRGKTCPLGNTNEFILLERLARRPGVYVSISSLIDDVWHDENTEKNTVQRTVSNLRSKLADEFGTGVQIDGSQKGHYALILS